MCQKLLKHISFILSTLLILSLSTGCGKKEKFESGNFRYVWNSDPIMLGIKSDTDTFSKDNVTFDLYFGVHDIGYDKKYNNNPKGSYKGQLEEPVLFAIYICPYEYYMDLVYGMEIVDYKTVENHLFVKEISEDDAFSGEYGYTMEHWKGITYNHCEKISIPSHLFDKDKGELVIKIIAFRIYEREEYYLAGNYQCVYFDYELSDDDDNVTIDFK